MPHYVDVHVGKRVRHRRWLLGMTQQQLGERVGTKFQQIQKYETGANRVSASRLWDISVSLSAPVEFFYSGLPEHQKPAPTPTPLSLVSDTTAAEMKERISSRETTELIRIYYAIPETQRRRLLDLARVLSDVG